MKLVPGQTNSLTTVAKLGGTSCGEVFRVTTTTHGDVAMKVPVDPTNADQVALLKQEGQILHALNNNPNIVRFLAEGTVNGSPWLLLELLQKRTPITQLSTATIVAQLADICSALDVAHQHGIVHRDLDLTNIMATALGQWKIIDFGAAYLPGSPIPKAVLAALGTASIMAPEAWNGVVDDPRSDLYSLGCCLFRFMSNAYPFGETPRNTVRDRHLNDPVPAVARQNGPPQELLDLINDLLKKNPNNRIQSAADVKQRLLALPPIP